MNIFLWLVLGAVAWQTITFLVFLASKQDELTAARMGGGLPLMIAVCCYNLYDRGIRKAWCRWMAKRYAVIVPAGELWPNVYRIEWKDLQALSVGTKGPGNYVMLGLSPNYNHGAYRKSWYDVDYAIRYKYLESNGDGQ